VSKDVRIRGYFSKPEGIREQRSLGNTGLDSKYHHTTNIIILLCEVLRHNVASLQKLCNEGVNVKVFFFSLFPV
jgi:hypothetical protein